MTNNDLVEDDILVVCALRFDGWKYQQATNFNQRKAIDQFFETGQWNISRDEQLATFFLLQRGLAKWNLVYEPKHGRYWRAFRMLFLLAHSYEIPEEYRLAGYYEQWEREYRPNLAEHVARIRTIHMSTAYDDNAKPT